MAKLRYIPLIVRVTPDTTNTELYLKIAHEIEQRGNDNIFRFKVQGMRDPDISFDLDALKLRFRIADIIDETEPQYDFSALFPASKRYDRLLHPGTEKTGHESGGEKGAVLRHPRPASHHR